MIIGEAAKTFIARPIAEPSIFSSAVSIVVPFHGQYELCTKLVESITFYTKSNYYELCIVDDASPNKSYLTALEANLTKQYSNRRGGSPNQNSIATIKCIRSSEHLGFGGAIKLGFEHTTHPYVVFINSDCVIEDPNWLRAMGETLLNFKSENVRMVSALTNNPVNGTEKQRGVKGQEREDGILEKDECLSLYCFMAHRELFGRIGGFIKEYPIGCYEDEEIARRMQRYGYKQGVSGKSWVYHLGEATIKSILRKDPSLQDVIEDNYERCLEDLRNTQ